jgi:hypothetical protein
VVPIRASAQESPRVAERTTRVVGTGFAEDRGWAGVAVDFGFKGLTSRRPSRRIFLCRLAVHMRLGPKARRRQPPLRAAQRPRRTSQTVRICIASVDAQSLPTPVRRPARAPRARGPVTAHSRAWVAATAVDVCNLVGADSTVGEDRSRVARAGSTSIASRPRGRRANTCEYQAGPRPTGSHPSARNARQGRYGLPGATAASSGAWPFLARKRGEP